MKNRPIVKVSVFLIIIIVSIGAYVLIGSRIKTKYTPNYLLDDFVPFPQKKVGVNEYRVASVSDSDMIKMYFNMYIGELLENIESAYQRLDDESKLEVFPNIDSFRSKVVLLTNDYKVVPEFSGYTTSKADDGKVLYIVKDKRDNIYTFRIDAAMKYTVTFN